MSNWTVIKCIYVCVYVFAFVLGQTATATSSTQNNENSPQNSGDVIMKEDAEEVFYNVDLEKYNELGIRCPDPEPPQNGYIVGEGNRVGSVVYVECEEGYRLQGPTVMACVPVTGGAHWDPRGQRTCEESTEELEEISKGKELDEHFNSNMDKLSVPPSFDPRHHPKLIQREKHKMAEIAEEEGPEEEHSEEREGTHPHPPFCLEKPEVGPCRAYFKRYYFNKATRECHTFVYGGCQGNENNFETMEDCDEACLGLN